MTKKQAGEERVYSAYTSTLLFITKESQDRNSNREGTWRQELITEVMEECCLVVCSSIACLACFLIEPRGGTTSTHTYLHAHVNIPYIHAHT